MSRQMKVGIFLIGDNRNFWSSKTTYRAAFLDVAGLKPGAPVRMGGLDIGTVTAVGHGPTPTDTRIYVTLSIVKSEAIRIREDTVAKVVNKGLLGDKMVELTVGSSPTPADPEVLLKTEEPKDMLADANALANRAQRIMERIEPLAQQLGDPKFSEDIRGSVASLHQILDAVAKNDSIAHRMLFDAKEAERFDSALANLTQATGQLNGLLADLHDVTTHVRQGPGIAHAVIYDGEMSKNAAGTLAELHEDLKAIREGNGIAHAILYGDDSSQHVVGNLNAMTDDLRQIIADVKAGKGTIGALLVDPSIYEDIKSAIGNVERNQVLRALVRYSIKQDEGRPHVQIPTSASASTQPEPKPTP